MIKTIQATGHAPVVIECTQAWRSMQMLQGDKRGVQLWVFALEPCWSGAPLRTYAAALTYVTSWPTERPFCRVFETYADDMPQLLRNAAKTMLPPGAGYPAMPQYESRQAKLAGMLEVATLTAISEVLASIAEGDE